MTFLDIETVPNCIVPTEEDNAWPSASLGNIFLSKEGHLFASKYKRELEGMGVQDYTNEVCKLWLQKASFHAEFSKVICISIGMIVGEKLRVKTLYNRNELPLLQELAIILSKIKGKLCAHNGLEFDFAFLMRRYIINGLPIPEQLNSQGKKPWEVPLEDTMQLWSGTAWNYKISLELLAHVLGLESPKQNMNGSQVSELYYAVPKKDQLPFDIEDGAKNKISQYCATDVTTLANCWLRMNGKPIITDIETVIEQPTLFQ